jgi:hypothetical protein
MDTTSESNDSSNVLIIAILVLIAVGYYLNTRQK